MASEQKRHWGIFLDSTTAISLLLKKLLSQTILPESRWPQKRKGLVFSQLTLDLLLKEEAKHDKKIIDYLPQPLQSMSSGEQKKALLTYLLEQKPDFIILDNPFDHLDKIAQITLRENLNRLSHKVALVQLIDRKADTLSCITDFIVLKENRITSHSINSCPVQWNTIPTLGTQIPRPLVSIKNIPKILVDFKNVFVSYGNRLILKDINWTIKPNEFWHLKGPNGSGKTTLLSMITGENTKAYGQEIHVFGKQKGSGESIWDIKEKIGYFSPSMTASFSGNHTTEQMLISGLYDSIGLYTQPSDAALLMARQWLLLLDMLPYKNTNFNVLTPRQQRMVMTARAMVKRPLLLILDEPTVGLDDNNAAVFVSLVNTIAKESTTSILFVSHREEPGLAATSTYRLEMTPEGSIGSCR